MSLIGVEVLVYAPGIQFGRCFLAKPYLTLGPVGAGRGRDGRPHGVLANSKTTISISCISFILFHHEINKFGRVRDSMARQRKSNASTVAPGREPIGERRQNTAPQGPQV
jgi:hypothetical protein